MAFTGVDRCRQNTEVCRGDVACKKRLAALLKVLRLPLGLLPLEDMEEVNFNQEVGSLWVVQKKNQEHNFKSVNQLVSYATKVTAVEPRKIKKLTGVETREIALWLSVVEVYIEDPSTEKITFKIGISLADNFLVSAFEFQKHRDGFLLKQGHYISALLRSLNMEDWKPLPNPSPTSTSQAS